MCKLPALDGHQSRLDSSNARATPRLSPPHLATTPPPDPLGSNRTQNFPGWHLWRKIQVVEENCNPPFSVVFLLPDLEVPRACRGQPAAFLGCQCELMPTPVEGQWALYTNGDDGYREFGAVAGEQLFHTVPEHGLCFDSVE